MWCLEYRGAVWDLASKQGKIKKALEQEPELRVTDQGLS